MISDKLNNVAKWLGKIGMYVTFCSNTINNLRDMEKKHHADSGVK